MFGLGVPELVMILVILLVLFGSTKLPKLARSIGESSRELRKSLDIETNNSSDNKDDKDSKDDKAKTPPTNGVI